MAKMHGWTPRRRGNIYCSPLCGFKCTRAAYDRAKKRGATLAKRLGPGWVPVVWENMGWHYRVEKGLFEVRQYDDGRVTVYLQTCPQFIVSDDRSPERALAAAASAARKCITDIEVALLEVP